jgi:hypothetical protein
MRASFGYIPIKDSVKTLSVNTFPTPCLLSAGTREETIQTRRDRKPCGLCAVVACGPVHVTSPSARWANEITQDGRDRAGLFVSFVCFEFTKAAFTNRDSESTLPYAQAFSFPPKEQGKIFPCGTMCEGEDWRQSSIHSKYRHCTNLDG